MRFASEDPFQSEPLRDSRFQSAPGLYQPSSASYSSPAVSYTLGSAAYNPVNLVANVTSQPLHESYQDRNHQLNSQSHSAPWHAETSAQRRPVCGRDGVSWSTAGQAPEWSQAAAAPGNYQYQANHAVQPDLSGINNCANDPETLQAILNNMNATARARLAFSPPAAPIPWGEQRQAIPPENRVYPERLLTGKDNRTTVMVKDVPVRLTLEDHADRRTSCPVSSWSTFFVK